jgi:hypothetical protein
MIHRGFPQRGREGTLHSLPYHYFLERSVIGKRNLSQVTIGAVDCKCFFRSIVTMLFITAWFLSEVLRYRCGKNPIAMCASRRGLQPPCMIARNGWPRTRLVSSPGGSFQSRIRRGRLADAGFVKPEHATCDHNDARLPEDLHHAGKGFSRTCRSPVERNSSIRRSVQLSYFGSVIAHGSKIRKCSAPSGLFY